jgi:predicted ATPase
LHGTGEVALGSRALDLLIALVENVDSVLSRDYLVSRVWPTTFVEESSLRVHVASLRRALGGGPNMGRRIVNVPGRGYSFIGPVEKLPRAVALPVAPEARRPLLPAAPPLVGRGPALAAAEAMLQRHRVVTIVGAGGVGKTALALHLLVGQAARVAGRTVHVDLSQPDSRPLLEQVADALLQSPADVMPALQQAPALLLLDNCDHLLEDVAGFVEAVLVQAPLVQLLCTSREPLNVAEERVMRLEPLALPPASASTFDEALGQPAVELFVERAKAAADSLAFDDADVPALRALCELLDGLPLALELAAARIESLGLHGQLARQDEFLDMLTRGRRTAAPRHRSLRAVIDWGYELLDADERRVFCALSLFSDPFSLTSAAAVAARPQGTPATEEVVLALVDKSMLVACPEAGLAEDGTCFRLPDMLRRYGRERLAGLPDAEQVNARYARELLRLVRAGAQAPSPSTADRAP